MLPQVEVDASLADRTTCQPGNAVKASPLLDGLRDDPGFVEALARIRAIESDTEVAWSGIRTLTSAHGSRPP